MLEANIFTSSIKQLSTGAVVTLRLSLLHNFIKQSLNSGSAKAQILLTACWRSSIVKIFDRCLG